MEPRLKEAVDRIVAAADPEAVILFGSQARGEVVNPPKCAAACQTIGVRQPSRPLNCGQNSMP